MEPWAANLAEYRAYRDVAARFATHPLMPGSAGDPAPPISLWKLAALVRMSQSTPGQCDDTKLEAPAAIFAHMPGGRYCGNWNVVGKVSGGAGIPGGTL